MKYINYQSRILKNLYYNLLFYSKEKEKSNYKKANHIRGNKKINFDDSLAYAKEQISAINKDADILKKLDETKCNSEILKILELECENYEKRLLLRDEEFNQVVENFDEETKKAFLILKDDNNGIVLFDNKAIIKVEETGSYSVNLILENEYVHEQDNICGADIIISDIELVKTDSGYALGLIYDDVSNDDEVVLKEYIFSKASVNLNLFDYVSNEMFWSDNAWDILADILNELEMKANWGIRYLNEKEKEIFPLTKFAPIVSFLQWKEDILNYQVSKEQYDLMMKYIEKSGCTYLMPLLDELYIEENEKNRARLCSKFSHQLKRMEAKELWRLIREELLEACNEYASKTELYVTEENVKLVRNYIDEEMKLNKIEGTYPYYYIKHSENGQDLISYIKCVEDSANGNLFLNFNVAVAIEKEEGYIQKFNDFYDLFYAKNYVNKKAAIVNIQRMDFNLYDEGEYSNNEIRTQIEKYCIIIAKIVHGKKLDKSEKAYVYGEISTKASILFGAIVCILMGLLFSILLCFGMAILSILITFVATCSFSEVADILLDKIWLYGFLGVWGAFSGILFLILVVNEIKNKWY